MREIYEFAEFLASAWRLANKDERIPTSHGVLDQALYEMKEELPAKFQDLLTFGNTRVGFRCYELPDILYAAQANLLTSEPNPTYLTTAVQIDDTVANMLLRRRRVDVPEAIGFAKELARHTKRIAKQDASAA
ncbi:hypothetical protein ACCS93_33310 [Rhizobium ruizarguesonis]